MKKRTWSNVCICIGCILIIIAAYIFYESCKLEELARTSSANALSIMIEEMEAGKEKEAESVPTEIVVEGYTFMGILEIESLGLVLPIQTSWSYDQLKISPCIYQSEPLSIAAHNYQTHFGQIGNLEVGEVATIQYVSGEIIEYKVVEVTKVHETEIDAVVENEYDLTLFTCNYSNNTERIVVGLIEN